GRSGQACPEPKAEEQPTDRPRDSPQRGNALRTSNDTMQPSPSSQEKQQNPSIKQPSSATDNESRYNAQSIIRQALPWNSTRANAQTRFSTFLTLPSAMPAIPSCRTSICACIAARLWP